MYTRIKFATARPSEDGFTLIEVLVALMIFAMIAVGIAYGLTSTMIMTHDSRAREVATNLAASQIEAARAIGDPFKVFNDTTTVPSEDGGSYVVKQETSWVTPTGAQATCGTGGGALQYKHVGVTVTWTGMRDTTAPVRTDTLLSPSTRINDPTLGTITVSVRDAQGIGKAGVTFTAGSLVTTPTDADGCSFILKVAPGNYAVKLTSNGIDSNQVVKPTSDSQPVVAGSSTSYSFQYDTAATYKVKYASNNVGPVIPKVATDLATTFFNTYGSYPVTVGSTNQTLLHPYSVGYQAFAGRADICAAVNPVKWEPDTRVDPPLVATLPDPVSADPGLSADINVPMGIVTVAGGSGSYLTAVSQTTAPLPGQPACTATMTYKFGSIVPNSGVIRVALPYGSWKLSTSNSSSGSSPTTLLGSRVALVTPGQAPDGSGLFVLDPRGPQ